MTDSRTTKDQILDAAEEQFAVHGFAATSLRALTQSAGVNLAAVHYHFGSKGALLDAVFDRRLEPLHRQRLDALDELDGRAGSEPIAVEVLLAAYFEPVVRLVKAPGGQAMTRLLAQIGMEPPGSPARQAFFEQFRRICERFVPMLARSVPHLSHSELLWRFHFTVGAMAHSLAAQDGIRSLSNGECQLDEHMLDRYVAFAAAGIRAPLPAGIDGHDSPIATDSSGAPR